MPQFYAKILLTRTCVQLYPFIHYVFEGCRGHVYVPSSQVTNQRADRCQAASPVRTQLLMMADNATDGHIAPMRART